MKRLSCLVLGLAVAGAAFAQGFAGDLLAGKLIKPRVGQWAWYELHDTRNNKQYLVREAIVGREDVDRETGYWLEIEIVPKVGYKTIMKALLTGPASDPKNIKRVILKNGLDPVVEVPIADTSGDSEDRGGTPRRESVGVDDVVTKSGTIRAEQFKVTENGQTMRVWMNKDVLPTGIVRLQSANGEWIVRSYGEGGKDGESVLDKTEKAKAFQEKSDAQNSGQNATDIQGDNK